jgi:hypothetical protein
MVKETERIVKKSKIFYWGNVSFPKTEIDKSKEPDIMIFLNWFQGELWPIRGYKAGDLKLTDTELKVSFSSFLGLGKKKEITVSLSKIKSVYRIKPKLKTLALRVFKTGSLSSFIIRYDNQGEDYLLLLSPYEGIKDADDWANKICETVRNLTKKECPLYFSK